MDTQPYQGEGPRAPTGNRNATSVNSILVADCGTVFTKVSLLGIVEGQYRLMARGQAPTTVAAPYEDITQGIIQAITEIEFITGRHFIAGGRLLSPEKPNGDGTDVFVATVSACGPLRMVVLGAVTPALEALVKQAVASLHTETHILPAPSHMAMPTPVGAAAAVGGPSSNPSRPLMGNWTPEQAALEWERQLQRMRDLQPHAAMIVGMADGPTGPIPLQEASQLLLNALKERNERKSTDIAAQRMPVLYGGAPQYIEAVRNMLQGFAEVAPIDTPISPASMGSINLAVNTLYERDVIKQTPGFDHLRSWSTSTPVTTTASLSSLIRFLAQHYTMNVTAVDVGGATTTVLVAGERGEFAPFVNSGAGVGPGIGAVLQQAGAQRLMRWLPFDSTEDELRQYTLNRMLHPQVIPTSERDLQIGLAFAREAIILTLEGAQYANLSQFRPDLIAATGSILAHAPRYGQVVLLLLDALQPQGVTSIILDRTMLLSQLGAVATVAPVAAVQVNENDAVTYRLGTCVVPFGDIRSGQPAVRVGLEYRDGRQATFEVIGGTIKVIPLAVNEQAALTLSPTPGVDVGLGPGERARAAEEIDGGLVGLIVDARGRPLLLPPQEAERRNRLSQWMQALGA